MRHAIAERLGSYRRRAFDETNWNVVSPAAARRRFSGTAADDYQEIRRQRAGTRPVGGQAKRSFDIAAALTAILLLLPLFCLIALAIKVMDRGPVLYRHRRIGRGGEGPITAITISRACSTS